MGTMYLSLEKYGPIVFSVSTTICWLLLCAPFPKDPSNILMSSISVGAIVTGFLSTTEGILLTINPKSTMVTKLYESGHFKSIVSYLSSTIRVGIFFSITSLFSLMDESIAKVLWFQIIWVFLASFLLSSFYRIAEIIIKILKTDPKLR